MANGEQIEKNIRHAQEKVALHGYLNQQEVTDRDVMLAGFGYLGDQFAAAEKGVVKLKLEGKGFIAIGISIGGIVVGIAVKWLGG